MNVKEPLKTRRKKRPQKPDIIETACCFVHGDEPVDTRLLHLHHRKPLGYGGKDVPENCHWLCGSCHDHVHRFSHMIAKGHPGIARDLAVQVFPSAPAIRARLMDLAVVAAEAVKTHQPKQDQESEKDEVVVMQLHMPKSLHRRLKTLAANHTHQKSGRKVGLYRYCLTILQNHCSVAEAESGSTSNAQQLYRYSPEPGEASQEQILSDL